MSINNPVIVYDSAGEKHLVQLVKLIDAEGNYPKLSAIISSGNSSTDPLASGATFTGEMINDIQAAIIYCSVASDVSGTLNLEQSIDGVNWDFIDSYYYEGTGGKTYSFQAATQFARVVYVNNGTPQSYFRLQTVLKPTYGKPSSHRIQDTISDDDDGELTVNVLKLRTSQNNYVSARSTLDGNLTISDNSNGLSISRGDVTGVSFIHKFGNAPDFDTVDNEITVWDGAEDGTSWELMNYVYSTTADIDRISSTDNADTQDIEIEGLDTDYNLVIQTITLTGQTPASLTTSLIRVFRMKNVDSTDIVGHVFCFVNVATTGGVPNTVSNIRAIIQPGNNQTLMSVYTIPAGQTGYMRDWYASTAGASRSSNYIINLYARTFGQVFQLKHKSAISDTGTSYIQHTYEEPEVFTEKTDIEIKTQMTELGGTGASVSTGFDIVLIDN